MFKPTPAQKKAILARLPKPPTGKAWKQYVGKQVAKAGSYIVSYEHINGRVGYCSPCSGYLGRKASSLAGHESTWRLVATRKRSPETVYYCPKDGDTRWTAKLCGFFDHTYRSSGVYESNGDETAPMFSRGARVNIESGMWKTISRTEFLSRIKGYGLNEDGTKIVPPPKVRFFKHVDGFDDPLLFVALRPDETHYFIYKDREAVEAKDKYWTKARCEEAVKEGSWIEVFQPEVDAALAPKPKVKTELELTREALTAANARIATLEAKIASAKEALS